MSVQEWTETAFSTLDRAQRLSSSAQGMLESTANLLTVDLPKSIRDATAQHQKVVAEQRRVGGLLENVTAFTEAKAAAHQKSVEGKLHPALARLESVLAQLQAVQVPSFLVKTPAGKEPRLADFVSHDEIALLQRNIAVYTDNCAKVSDLMVSTAAQSQRDFHAHSAKVSAAAEQYDADVVPLRVYLRYEENINSEDTDKKENLRDKPKDAVGTILRENDALGSELVHLLQMLTNHYDQCALALQWVQDSAPDQAHAVDLEVLQNDTLELPAVLKEVRAVHDIIVNNERRAAALADQKVPLLAGFAASCDSLHRWLLEFESLHLTRLVLVALEFDRVAASCSLPTTPSSPPVSVYVSVLDELSHHYTQFSTVYHTQYLSELHYEQFVYPRKFFKTLDDFVNGQLLLLEDDERNRRRDWLRKYGDYIPSIFQLPGDLSYPGVVQVISEGLDEVNTPAAERDEERLLALIRTARAKAR